MRALDILRAVDIVAAEDTRHTSGLLSHFAIQKKLLAVHEHNEQHAARQLIELLQAGKSVAIVTDAGTPGISDPGAVLVDLVRDAAIPVVPVPGASAVVAAMSAAGILSNGFLFYGFLPASGAQRRKALDLLKSQPVTIVFYEAPHRIVDSIKDIAAVLGGQRRIVIARELTKTFESFHRCALSEAHAWLLEDANRQRGEFVLMVEPDTSEKAEGLDEEAERILKLLVADLPLKQAVKLATEITGQRKNTLYDRALQLQSESKT